MDHFYNGIKFFDSRDGSNPYYLERSEIVLDELDININYNINNIIEFYNITRYFDNNYRLTKWSDDDYNHFSKQSKKLKPIIGKYISKIDCNNFISTYEQTDIAYKEDFWALLNEYIKSSSIATFDIYKLLEMYPRALYQILKYKNIVDAFSDVLKSFMMTHEFTAEILIEKYAVKNGYDYYIPNSITSKDKEIIVENYVKGSNPNLNFLQVLLSFPNSKDFSISDLLRRDIQYVYKREEKNLLKYATVVESNLSVGFTDVEDLCKIEYSHLNANIEYNKSFFESYLEPIHILSILKNGFEFFSNEFNCLFVSKPDDMGILEQCIGGLSGKTDYYVNRQFHINRQLHNGTLLSYYNLLMNKDIELQSVFKWFFEDYLVNRLGIRGFSFNASSINTTLVEKIKNLSSEMERVLTQYSCYVLEGKIDDELVVISSQQIKYKSIPSMQTKKFCYLKSDKTKGIANNLFSRHATIKYNRKQIYKYKTLIDMLLNEDIKLEDFYPDQQSYITQLISDKYLKIDDDGYLIINDLRINILYNCFRYGSFRCYYHPEYDVYIQELEKNEDIYFENTLFPQDEAEYINYILNKAEFTNGPNIRNKYAHGNYSSNEVEQIEDYIELLKVMLMVIMRINEEFWLMYRQSI